MTRITYIEKTYGECRRNGRKVEDYSWEVTFLTTGPLVVVDRACYNSAELALERSHQWREGEYTIGEYGEPIFEDELLVDEA